MKTEPSITEHVTVEIMREIRTGRYQGQNRLPPEQEISATLGVSRTVVRDALSTLEREGFISRKRGVGTIINQRALSIKTRFDMEKEFLDMVRDIGKTPTSRLVDAKESPGEQWIAEKLEIPEGTPVLSVERLIFADGMPVIYDVDYMDVTMLEGQPYTNEDLEPPIFHFIEKFCKRDVFMDISEVHAVGATRKIAKLLDIAIAEPLLFTRGVGYDFYGKPILASEEYYVEGVFDHTVLRKKI